jgi:hypothetical protein
VPDHGFVFEKSFEHLAKGYSLTEPGAAQLYIDKLFLKIECYRSLTRKYVIIV